MLRVAGPLGGRRARDANDDDLLGVAALQPGCAASACAPRPRTVCRPGCVFPVSFDQADAMPGGAPDDQLSLARMAVAAGAGAGAGGGTCGCCGAAGAPPCAWPAWPSSKQALGRGPGWRRHAAGAGRADGAGADHRAATARIHRCPVARETIILAMDVSGSMRRRCAANRLVASQEAAKAFVIACRFLACGRGLVRHRRGGATAHLQPRRRGGGPSTASSSSAARHRLWSGAVAGHVVPRGRHRPERSPSSVRCRQPQERRTEKEALHAGGAGLSTQRR